MQKHPLGNSDGRGTWEIVDESGNSYIFSENEITEVNGNNYSISWKLTKVLSVEGKELVSFKYKYTENKDEVSYKTHAFELFSDPRISDISKDTYIGEKSHQDTYKWLGYELSKIIIPGKGYLDFDIPFSTEKTLPWKFLLRKISSYSSNNELKKVYSFDYISQGDKAFLSKITMKDDKDFSVEYRKFTYFPGLPPRGSYAQDFWGYYNGANNTSLFPYKGKIGIGASPPYIIADRYPSEKAIAGTIKEIIYPTGGKTEFEFENNRFFLSSSGTSTVKKFSGNHYHSGYGRRTSNTFSTTLEEEMSTNISLSLHPMGVYTFSVKLVNVNNNQEILSVQDGNVLNKFRQVGTNSDGTIKFEYSGKDILKPGTYRWITEIIDNESRNFPPQPISISFTYYDTVKEQGSNEKRVGGIRILRITNYDSAGKILNQKRYTYLNSQGQSSGIESPEPQFIRSYVVPITLQTSMYSYAYLGLEEITDFNLNRYTGSAVQYTRVTEETLENGNSVFKTDYEYQHRDFNRTIIPTTPISGFIAIPYSPNDYQEGLLKSKTDYRYEKGNYVPTKKEINNYSVIESGANIPFFRALSLVKYYENAGEEIPYKQRVALGTYDYRAAKVYISSKRIEEMRENTTVTTAYNYIYNNPLYQLVTNSTKSESGGDITKISYQYCFDTNVPIHNDMKAKNMINQPVSVVTTVNETPVEKISMQYGYQKNNRFIAPLSLKKQIGTSNTSLEANYHSYDVYGNPTFVSQNGTDKTFYLWSYQGKYPIAEIKGEYTFLEVESIVKNVFSVANIDALSELNRPDEQLLKNGNLQKAFPKALVTTYTYDSLYGILSRTAPNNIVTYYEYDAFGRLKCIKDHNEKVIEQYDYNYKKP